MRFASYTPTVETVERTWYVIDATGLNLGRLATTVATLLRGKHKPTYSPHLDAGDCVIVLNAGKVTVTGNKLDEEFFYRHSLYPGGLTKVSLREMQQKHPERVIEIAVKGMLPKNRLGRQIIKQLHVYAGNTHPHSAQKPVPYEVTEAKK
jgi:large subunit ribosomal protein L13